MNRDLTDTLKLIGRKGDFSSNIDIGLLSVRRLTGFFSQVLTDRADGKELRGRVKTLDRYLDSNRWQGKAGAFGYQDGNDWVRVVRGSESNVVGLPLELLERLLQTWPI